MSRDEISLIQGKNYVDDRGSLLFVNELDLSSYRRFYVIENHSRNFIRAWHGHMRERKVFVPIEGSFLVGIVPLTSVDNPEKNVEVRRTVLTAGNPMALVIPAGHANGLMGLSENAKLLVFSSSTTAESQDDDFRYPYDYWDIWTIENR